MTAAIEKERDNIQRQLQILKSGPMDDTKAFDRSSLKTQLNDSLVTGRHLIVYGPPGQGKTTLLRNLIKDNESLLVDCRSKLARKDIYRILLTHCGYSVALEKKRSGKFGGKASLNLFGIGVNGDASGELESKYRELQADLTKGTEVCSLIKETKPPKYIILNNFDFLSDNTQSAVASELLIFEEQSDLRFIIIGRWIDRYHIEKLSPELSGRLEKLYVPLWSKEDLFSYITDSCSVSGAQIIENKCLEYISELCNGDIGLFNRLARLYYQLKLDGESSFEIFKVEIKQYLVDRFLDINFARILEFMFLRDLLVSFSVTREIVKYRSRKLIADDLPDLESKAALQNITIDHTEVTKTTTGKLSLSYREKYTASERTDYGVYLGHWLFREFFLGDEQYYNNSFSVDGLARDFTRQFLAGANPIDERKLKRCIQSIGRMQFKNGITPEIAGVSANQKEVSVTDTQLIAYFEYADKEDFESDLEEYIDGLELRRKAKRRNDLCQGFSSRDVDRVLLEPMLLSDEGMPIDPESRGV
ncbi:MAG: ATP-binding protein [Pseudomonadota bacterium]